MIVNMQHPPVIEGIDKFPALALEYQQAWRAAKLACGNCAGSDVERSFRVRTRAALLLVAKPARRS